MVQRGAMAHKGASNILQLGQMSIDKKVIFMMNTSSFFQLK